MYWYSFTRESEHSIHLSLRNISILFSVVWQLKRFVISIWIRLCRMHSHTQNCCWKMKHSRSLVLRLVSLSYLRKLLFLTNHSSCLLLFLFPPQETEISTRRKECEALEAEVKKKNQTCQTLVSAPKIYPGLWATGQRLNWFVPESLACSHHTDVPWGNEWRSTVMIARFSGSDDGNWKVEAVNWELQNLWVGFC